MGPTGVEKHPLGGGRLPGIDVSDDADVPITFEGCLASHAGSYGDRFSRAIYQR